MLELRPATGAAEAAAPSDDDWGTVPENLDTVGRASDLADLPGPAENLEKVPRIWEGEGSRRSEILNPINTDYWPAALVVRSSTPR